MATFGKRLRELRTKGNLTQKDFGMKFRLSESAIGMYERDQREPSFELVKEFADYFNVSTDYLIGISDEFKSNSKGYDGMAFLGGPDAYTEEERAIARAAIEAYRKGKASKDK